MENLAKNEAILNQEIDQLIQIAGGDPTSFNGSLVQQMILTSLKLLQGGCDTGELKLMNRALKELRYAYRVFNSYKDTQIISIFGSARTPPEHPDYLAAKAFAAQMAKEGWMCITGAANGIMKAGIEGSSRDASFGLSIRLPFEVSFNDVIEGDPKLIVFRYFFTRKLMFVSQSNAFAVFPGGFGTLDELFEVLTLFQTGKSSIAPIVLLQGEGGNYWHHWKHYIDHHLLLNGWISEEDLSFFSIVDTPKEGVEIIKKFYSRYHSSRYAEDQLVIRMHSKISQKALEALNHQFSDIIQQGEIIQRDPLSSETEYLELPRLVFFYTRRKLGRLRLLIDAINEA